MSGFAKTCVCGRRVPAGQRCVCGRGSEADRMQRQPYRAAYRHASYRRNRRMRYLLVGGRCEICDTPLRGKLYPSGAPWECDHHLEARLFQNPEDANAVENLRCYCVHDHLAKKRGASS